MGNDQMASITASGQRVLVAMERFLAEIWPEVDNMGAVSNSLLEQIPAAMQFVPVELRGQILELTDATSKIAAIMQSMNPRLKASALFPSPPRRPRTPTTLARLPEPSRSRPTPGSPRPSSTTVESLSIS